MQLSVPPIALVVDDQEQNRVLLRSVLNSAGFQVEECSGGLDCLERCKSESPPTIVLLDVVMPDIGGLEVCRQLRQLHSKEELPVIMVTSLSDSTDLASGLRAGANDFISKPIDKTVLLARMENQLKLKTSHAVLDQQREELKRYLAIQTSVWDVLPEAICLTDDDELVVYSNSRFLSLCGDRSPFSVGDIFEVFLYGRLFGISEEIIQSVRANWKITVDREVRSEGPIASSIQVVTGPVRIDADSSLRFWLFRDWTNVRSLEDKINQQVRLQMFSTFTSGVAHSFNNVMGVIQGATDILARNCGQDKYSLQCVAMINSAVESGTKLSNKLSSFKSIMAGVSGHNSNQPGQIIDSIIQIAQETVGEGVTIEAKVGSSLPPLQIQPAQLAEVMSNLVSNAIDAIQESGAITIEAEVVLAAGVVVITVTDNGIGMDFPQVSNIFQPYYSAQAVGERGPDRVEGGGLGMWNVHSIVKAVGGKIEVDSTPGSGTRVRVTLPTKID